MSQRLSVDAKVFERIPGLRILVATVLAIPLPLDNERTKAFLLSAWQSVPERTAALASIQSDPQLAAWRRTFQSLSISVKKYTPSVENLLRRAAKSPQMPPYINPLVNLYNAISVKFVVPFGGFDVDAINSPEMTLRETVAGDVFHALDAEAFIELPSGEVAYCCGNKVVTRHINWKQSNDGLITEHTKNAVFMAELLPEFTDEELQKMIEEFTKIVVDICNVEPHIHVLTKDQPYIEYN